VSKASNLLKESYKKKKKENPRFSMQLIANRLGISLPFTSQILSGKRNLTPELLDGFSQILDLDSEQRDFLARHVLLSKKLKTSTAVLTHLGDQKDQKWPSKSRWVSSEKSLFWLLRDWRMIALLNATLLKNYDGSSQFLSARLGFEQSFVEEGLLKLKQADLLVEKNGKLVKNNEKNIFQSANKKEDIQAYHSQCMDNVKNALKDANADLEARYLSGYTTTTSKEKMEWARREAADFIKHLAEELSSAPGEELYQVSFQLIPLTKPSSSK
jgi:uncharacterized protein (TIGR02147 family)